MDSVFSVNVRFAIEPRRLTQGDRTILASHVHVALVAGERATVFVSGRRVRKDKTLSTRTLRFVYGRYGQENMPIWVREYIVRAEAAKKAVNA